MNYGLVKTFTTHFKYKALTKKLHITPEARYTMFKL